MSIETDTYTVEFEDRVASAMHALAASHHPLPRPVHAAPPTPKRRWMLSTAAVALVLIGVGGVFAVTDRADDQSPIATAPGSSAETASTADTIDSTLPATSSPVDSAAPVETTISTASPVTTVDLSTIPSPLHVVPYGVSSDDTTVQVREVNVVSAPEFTQGADGVGEVVLSYEVQLGFSPEGRSSVIEQLSPTTTDGQLAIDVSCIVDGCLSPDPVNDFTQTSLQLTVRLTNQHLTPGAHFTDFQVGFDDGSVVVFSIGQFAVLQPSADFADAAATWAGEPKVIQTVFGEGSFAYHAISAFGSIWITDSARGLITRIDAITGAVLATIEAGDRSNRLTASNDAVYVAAEPAIRIDPATNEATPITGGARAHGITSDGTTVWTAGLQGEVQRIDPDGTITMLDLPDGRWMDLAVSNGLVWAIEQLRPATRLIGFDGVTGEIIHDLAIPVANNGYLVRLVADESDVFVGADTGGGWTGQLTVVDPTMGAIVDTVSLSARPEGIALAPDYIWTSGVVLDRNTLEVVHEQFFGFTIARGPDGSIWGTKSVPGAQSGTFTATRTLPGEFK
ncbi:MAG TPA: hypothetical protein VMM60_04500 [Ilumatobacter sp.]|nr:hypothetical protein [Ilumatobacter sp.]